MRVRSYRTVHDSSQWCNYLAVASRRARLHIVHLVVAWDAREPPWCACAAGSLLSFRLSLHNSFTTLTHTIYHECRVVPSVMQCSKSRLSCMAAAAPVHFCQPAVHICNAHDIVGHKHSNLQFNGRIKAQLPVDCRSMHDESPDQSQGIAVQQVPTISTFARVDHTKSNHRIIKHKDGIIRKWLFERLCIKLTYPRLSLLPALLLCKAYLKALPLLQCRCYGDCRAWCESSSRHEKPAKQVS